jgi:hypothetical protein
VVAARHQLVDPGVHGLARALVRHVDVVHEQDIDPVHAEAFERVFDRAHHAVVGIIVDLAAVRYLEPLALSAAALRRAGLEDPPDLRRERVGVARLAPQEAVEARLGQPEPVERRGVVVADARLPRGIEDRVRLRVGNRAVEVAERRGAEAQFREREPAVSQAVPVPCALSHRAPPCTDMLE